MATQILPAPFGFDHISAPAAAPQRGRFRRVVSAMMEARQRQAEREVARYLEGLGRKLPDSEERDIAQRLF